MTQSTASSTHTAAHAITLASLTAVPAPRVHYPSDKGVHQLFEAQAATTPDIVAAVMGEHALTYGQLNQRANQLARHLVAQGLDGQRPVAVMMDRGLSCLVSLLAVMKSGAAYVPIDLSLPVRRVEYILSDCDAGCVLINRDSHARLEALVAPGLLAIDVDTSSIYQGDAGNLDRPVDGDQEAYSIYTSGSTGEPKGVMVHHRGLTNYVWWARKQYVNEDVRSFALYSSLSFDLTVTSIFVPLVCGRQIVIYPEPQDDVPLVTRVVDDNRVDVLKLTPAHLALVRNCDLATSRLKVLILGGEDLKAEHTVDVHRKLGGRAVIYNEYGPTETVVGCMIYRFDPERDTQGSVPIGAAIDNMRIYLLDEQLKPVQQGGVGEIHIGGEGVAIGYRNKPEVTAKHFVASPFNSKARLYASGDLGRVNSRGDLVFLGRKDFQIKLRGYRIELGEVENALLTVPGVKECAVVSTATTRRDEEVGLVHCVRCGIASNFPNTTYSDEGVCNHCHAFDKYKNVVDDYFSTMDELEDIVGEMKARQHAKYDCIVAFSGGKDSTYALCRMIDMGARVLAFTLDNGYISNDAKQNIDRVIARLSVDHRYVSTEHMNEIFVDSLRRHSNVCNGCFKTIYTLGMNLAHEVGIDHIVMGLSKGQLFETRLTELFRATTFDKQSFEKNLVEARKIYHRIDDVVGRRLDTSCVSNDAFMEGIRFVDFYRYCDVGREEMYDYIGKRVGWTRPIDTGRSTNCLINDVGIYVHNKERSYHNYSLPYSWDVRVGHISRQDALRELDDSTDIDENRVHAIMEEIGYELNDKAVESVEAQLVAYYVSPAEISQEQLRDVLAAVLPDYMLPRHFVQLDQIPLTPNGKVNRQALPKPDLQQRGAASTSGAPRNAVEAQLVSLWKDILMVNNVGIHDNFFEVGGHSLPALMLLYRIDAQFGTTMGIQEFSKAPTIAELALQLETARPPAQPSTEAAL